MRPTGIAARMRPIHRGINRNRSVAFRRNQDRNTMTFNKTRALHVGGASWLFLFAIGNSAFAEDAAPPSAATELPAVTVTAPSPIVRRKLVPSRNPTRVGRAAP